MKYIVKIIGAIGCLASLTNCTTTSIDRFQDLSLAGGGFAAADALGAEPAVSVATGLAALAVGNVAQGRREENHAQELEEANEVGKQVVMLETYKALQDRQRESSQSAGIDLQEVVVPITGYVTNDGVLLEDHDKVIFTR